MQPSPVGIVAAIARKPTVPLAAWTLRLPLAAACHRASCRLRHLPQLLFQHRQRLRPPLHHPLHLSLHPERDRLELVALVRRPDPALLALARWKELMEVLYQDLFRFAAGPGCSSPTRPEAAGPCFGCF